MPESASRNPAAPAFAPIATGRPPRRPVAASARASVTPLGATRSTALAVALATVSCAALANPERFRLAPGSVMQNDDTGQEGAIGYARGLPYQVVQGYAIAEGDMVLGRVDSNGRLEVPMQRRGLGQSSLFDRWPDGIVPYAFHPELTEIQQRNVEAAIARLNEKTRIVIVPNTAAEAEGYKDYIQFEPSSGCASYVGRQLREDAQSLWVADSCSVGSIVHEISHAIGLFHEHTRPDRDNYVRIDWDEIIEDKRFNFEVYDAGAESYGQYDYGSIMHYGERFFSRSGERTIIPPENTRIGQRDALSADDIAALDGMYATDLSLDASVLETDRGIEIDLSITNAGTLGANRLTLRLLGDPGTDWLSISADSGWDCLSYAEELRCERRRLLEQESSRFTVVAEAATTRAESLALRVESHTLDLDPSNNGINDGALKEEVKPAGSGTSTLPDTLVPVVDDSENDEPEAGAALEESTLGSEHDRAGTRASEDAAGGGGGGAGGALVLLLAPLGARRWRFRIRAGNCG